ncbi:MAG: WXG100 family type VII secretion target, partial [Rhodococcus sp. (in: high G+C Gram-positive bacteria)]|uniref:WXG100 family type VII secretion target n=1 Tax=Rhodococcus sp. TaxID=1831 RepID=UPI003BB1CD40
MSNEVVVDTSVLREAARSMDMLFDDATSRLNAIDAAITDSSGAWPGAAGESFGHVVAHFDEHRGSLQKRLGELSNELLHTAAVYDEQDHFAA